ncbi:MAG: class I SAM-dependent methyltransferase [Thiohalocapsa sp.]
MQVLETLDQLDAKLAECDRAERESADQLRKVFASFCMTPPADLPDDPFSPHYRDAQLALYRRIAGKDYALANEATVFEVCSDIRAQFPWHTQSSVAAGDHLMAVGFLLRVMALAPGSRVLEFGSGWGNTTLALAALGHQVTAVDIEARFCELVARRAAHDGLAVELVNADFLAAAETLAGDFDAVIFFESFHHADDHLRLLRRLRRLVRPDGALFLAAEPIQPDFPCPWGLRLDGQSLWSIRKHGWLELGFNDRYFRSALAHTGWFARRHRAGVPGWLNVWEARRREEIVFRFAGDDPALRSQVGARQGGAIVLRRAPAGTALFGPYAALPAERYVARILFRGTAARHGNAVMDVCAAPGPTTLATRRLDMRALVEPVVELPFEAADDLREVEVRLFCDAGFTAEIAAVEIRPAANLS